MFELLNQKAIREQTIKAEVTRKYIFDMEKKV